MSIDIAPLSATEEVEHEDRLNGNGVAESLIGAVDWARTELGPAERWPESLRRAVSIGLKHAEAALRESQTQLEAEVSAMSRLHTLSERLTSEDDLPVLCKEIVATAIALTHADAGTVQLLDEATEELVLLATAGFERPMTAHFHRVDASSHTSCGIALQTGRRTFIDFDVPASEDPEGSLRMHVEAGYLSAQSTPLITRSGRPIGMVSTHWRHRRRPAERELRFLDLLARQAAAVIEGKQAEEALRRSEERFRALVSASSDVVYRMSADWSEMRHLEGREFIADTLEPSRTWLEKYIHPDDQERVMAAINEAIRTQGVFQLEHRVLRVDGTLGWTFSRAIPISDRRGKVLEWFGAASDITRRKEVEAALERQWRLYEAILANTPDLAYVFDLNHRFIYANEGLLRMWGKTWQEAIGKNCLELGYEPWHAAMHDREIEQVVATKQPVRGEVPFTGTFGRRIYDYILVPVLGEDGEVEAVAGTTRDVTDYRRAEEALREADRRKDEFLAMLAHELRNPLAPIRTAARILKKQGSQDPLTRRSQEMVERQVQHMARLLDDLLDVSRITRGMVRLEREQLDLREVVVQAVDAARSFCEERDHTVSVLVPPESLVVAADRVRLEQVIVNLLTNAAKYTDPGGKVTVSLWQEGGEAVLAVADTGRGINPELLPHLFELFRQGERPLDRSQGGLGIGLTLVKRLVELHGGTVAATSAGVQQGSQFTVRLPLARREGEVIPVDEPAVNTAG